MSKIGTVKIILQTRKMVSDSNGYNQWECVESPREIIPRETGIIICDMWDKNWPRGANERAAVLGEAMNAFIQKARTAGYHIIHAPSDTMDYYKDHPCRRRILEVPHTDLPEKKEREVPKLPIDDSDGGSDTNQGDEQVHTAVWTKQMDAVAMDEERDVLSDSGQEIYSYMVQEGIKQIVIMGVHANMCILDRSFAIMEMVQRGIDIILARDMTDSLYNPAMPPYVSHDEGTRLVVEYIEKFWCPTIVSGQLI